MQTKEIAKSKKMTTNDVPISTISGWEQDPGSGNQPDGGQLIQQPAPKLSSTSLPTFIQHPSPAPTAKVYAPGTPEFRYWSAAAALGRGSAFWSVLLPGVSWKVGSKLPVDLDHGADLNAFYDRVGLRFFHGVVGTRTFFSCESPDVVCHEQGHAVLDSFKPQLWNAASIEIAAFHESFGDMSAILCALQVPSLRHGLLAETAGVIYRSSRLSRLAEQLGWAIRQGHPAAVEADCLRNAVNSFFYRDPNTLPSSAPATSLSSEPHSFSRVFTAAFFEGVANMFKLRSVKDEANLLQVSIDMAQILIGGIKAAAVVPTFFSQVAANMIHFANAKFTSIAYGQALKSTFIRHGIISPAASSSFAHPAASMGIMEAASENVGSELPKLRLSVAEYDLGVDTIIVHSAAEAKRFDIAGAAMAIGSVVPPSQDETAKAFVEDLLRRGRLKVVHTKNKEAKNMDVTNSDEPETHKTHTHELQSTGNEYVLVRVRIDCGFHS